MATPERIALQPEDDRRDFQVLPGGLALEQSVEITPQITQPFAEIRLTLDESGWNNMTHEQLQEVWNAVSAYRGEVAELMSRLSLDDREALQVMFWIKGLQRDRPPKPKQE